MRMSVALCTFNGARYLDHQLHSYAAQTRPPDEVVVCDDGSTDDTMAIIERFATRVNFPVHLHRNPQNLGSTRNFEQAIRLCTGEVIALSDQDDCWYSHKLAQIERTLDNAPDAGLVFSDAIVVDDALQPLGYRLWQSVRFDRERQRAMLADAALATLLRHPVVTGAALAFRSRFRDLILPIPADWVHDQWIALRIAMFAQIAIIPEPLFQYRRHQSNQIGVEGVGFRSRLQTALRTDPAVYRRRAEQFRVLLDQVQTTLPTNKAAIAELQGKVVHLEVRGTLPDAHLSRFFPVLRELVSGRYSRYSGSILNAIRDVLLSHG